MFELRWVMAFEPGFGMMFWGGDCSLKDSFLELFGISRDRDALVADHMFAHNEVVHWDTNFIRLVHD
jgi:hypothetical protein